MSPKNDKNIHPSRRWQVLETSSRINSPSTHRKRFGLIYLSLSVVGTTLSDLLCFFTESYYGRLSSLSGLRAVWYKDKDSELQRNCSLILALSSLCLLWSPTVECYVGQIQSFYVYFQLRVGTGRNQKKYQFSTNLGLLKEYKFHTPS